MNCDILITEKIVGQPVDDLRKRFVVDADPELWKDPVRLKARLRTARALIVRNQTQVTADLISDAPSLRVIGRAGAGLDNIDLRAASAAGIVVVSTPDQNSLSVAELTLAMMFALARRLTVADRSTKQGGWERQRFTGIELSGKTLGLVGLGRIGFLTGLRARALGMRVIAHDTYVSPDAAAVTETHAELVTFDELLARSDFVSCHVPLTPQTRGMFGYEQFCRMKSSAYFLNLARGELVNEAGLCRALDEGRIAGAALDVREKEPPGPSPLSARDDVILTPHIAAFTHEGQARVVAAVCGDVASVLLGESPRNFVNFPRTPRDLPN